jgi:DNA-nicking Smr family endonuclease
MAKKTKISEEELSTFRQAVEGTKPLTSNKTRLKPPAPRRQPIKQAEPEEFNFDFSNATNQPTVSGTQELLYKHSSISNKILRNLRKGQYNIEAVLDLHGKITDEAMMAVDSFLHQCITERMRVVLIIHGKGHHTPMPILKNKLNQWLRSISVVLAFCSATAKHGGQGAVYVLLKRTKEENLSG